MGKYAVPPEIRAMKPKGTMVKRIRGGYYVYEVANERLEDGRRRTKMGRCIGKIDPEVGFVPNGGLLRDEEVTCLDFGEWAVAMANSRGTLELLEEFFHPADAEGIYVAALIHFVLGLTYTKDLAKVWEMSVLSLRFPTAQLDHETASGLYEDLGRRQGAVLAMQQALADRSSGLVTIDGHVIGTGSSYDGLASKDHEFASSGESQMSLLMAFDARGGRPLLSRTCETASQDRADVTDLLSQARFRDAIFVVDRGFYSEENIALFTRDGNHYVVPLPEDLSVYKEAVSSLEMRGRFLWSGGAEATVVEFKDEQVGGRRVIAYRDLSGALAEQESYLRHMARGDKPYTLEGFDELSPLMGVTVLQTSLTPAQHDAESVWGLYKQRWSAETYFDYLGRGRDAHAPCQQDYYRQQGLAFVMLVSGLIHREVADAVAASGLDMSIGDVFMDARIVKANRRAGIWVAANCKKKRARVLDALHTSFEVVPEAD